MKIFEFLNGQLIATITSGIVAICHFNNNV